MKMSGKSPLGSPHPSAAIMTTKAEWAALGCGDPRRISETKMGSGFHQNIWQFSSAHILAWSDVNIFDSSSPERCRYPICIAF